MFSKFAGGRYNFSHINIGLCLKNSKIFWAWTAGLANVHEFWLRFVTKFLCAVQSAIVPRRLYENSTGQKKQKIMAYRKYRNKQKTLE